MKTGSRDVWVLLGVFVALVVGGIFLASPQTRTEFKVSTTYNSDPLGVKAFYTLLGDRLGYRVERLRRSYISIPRGAKLLFVVQPRTRAEDDEAISVLSRQPHYITDDETGSLKDWVKRGGVAVFLSDGLSGVPAAFGSDQRLGKGYVYAFSSRKPITNRGMRDYRNALTLLRIIDRHASKRDLILFDEYHHGIGQSRSLWSYAARQVKVAGLILVLAGIVLCHTRGRRFGAVRNTPKSETVRPGYEFVESLARFYRRARATDIAAEALCRSFRQNLCGRLGLPADAPSARIARMLSTTSGAETVNRVSAVLARCRAAEAGEKPTEPELLDLARELQRLERELAV